MISDSLKKFADNLLKLNAASVKEIFIKGGEAKIAFSSEGHIDFDPLVSAAKKLLPFMQSVITSPLSRLEGKLEVKRAEGAINLTPLSIKETMKDMRLWKLSYGKPKPEKVYSSVNYEELGLYENRVVKALIDRYVRMFSSLEQSERSKIKTLYSRYQDAFALSRVDLMRILGSDSVVLSSALKDNRYNQLSEMRKKFMRFMYSDFYYALSEAAPIRERTVTETMIFAMNEKYFRCLEGWQFLNKFERSVSGLDADERRSAYTCYIALSLVKAYLKMGFTLSGDAQIKDVYGGFSLEGLKLYRAPFEITVNAAEDKIYISVSNLKLKIKQTYKMGAYGDLFQEFKKDEQFLFTPHFESYDDRFVIANSDEDVSLGAVGAVAKMTVFTVKGDKSIYEAVCPVCGESHIEEKKLNYKCDSCGAEYIFMDDHSIWINGFTSHNKGESEEI